MSTNLSHPPLWRVLRTALAIIIGLAVLTPAAVTLLEAVGLEVPSAAILAIGSAAVLVATAVNAAISDAGRVPVLRTLVQVLTALATIAGGALATLAQGGINLDGPRITAALGALIMIVSTAQNLLEHRGVIATLGTATDPGAPVDVEPPCIGCDPVAPHGENPELIDDGQAR